jgi:hypothetical protein
MQHQSKILNEVISLEAYFKAGLQRATGLRKELENLTTPVPPRRGLSPEQRANLHTKRLSTIIKKNKK